MKRIGIVTLISVLASAAAPTPRARAEGATLVTAKSVEQFGGCFVDAQDRAALAWSFVPQSHGGTFSNLGASGARAFYYLAVADRGSERQVRLEQAVASLPVDERVARAVNQCI